MRRFEEAFIFLAEGGDPAKRTVRESELVRTVHVPVPDPPAAAAVATELRAGGLDLIELYGGLGPREAAAVIDAAGGEVPVGLVGVEAHEVPRNRAVIFMGIGADPARDRYVHEHGDGRTTLVGIPDPDAAPAQAAALVNEGVEHIEICGGLGPLVAAAVMDEVGGRASVASVMFGFESLPAVAAYRRRFEEALAGS